MATAMTGAGRVERFWQRLAIGLAIFIILGFVQFALRGFADSLRSDEPELRVTTVYPGRTDSDMQRELIEFEGGTYDPANFLKPETVAAAVANAVATPRDGHMHEVVLRPAER